MTVYGHGSADPRILEKYDHLPPEQAIIRAWTDGDPSPRWHGLAMRDVHNAMPLLARAVERLVAAAEERRLKPAETDQPEPSDPPASPQP